MKKITIGLIPSPDVSQKLVDKIIDKLKINIAKKLDKNIDWQFEVKVNTFVGAAEYVNETIQKVIEMKERNNWDYAVSINDLPSIDRKSTRLNSSHVAISYAVFCLKKKS